MNRKDYDKVLSKAHIGDLISMLFWCSYRVYYFDVKVHRGHSFASAFTEANKKTQKELKEFFIKVETENV